MLTGHFSRYTLRDMFKDRLRARRIELGLTQETLAQLSGLRLQAICKYENDRQSPLADSVAKLAKALGCTTDYLLGMDEGVQ